MSLIDRGDYSIYGVKKVEFVLSFIKMYVVKFVKLRSVIMEVDVIILLGFFEEN